MRRSIVAPAPRISCQHGGVNPTRVEVPDQAPPGPGLPAASRAAAYALCEALFSTRQGPPPEGRLAWLVDELDHFLSYAGARARLSFLLCLHSVDRMAPAVARKAGPLSSLPVGERLAAIERFERSPLGLSLFGAKAILCILYYEHPESLRDAGVEVSCLGGAT